MNNYRLSYIVTNYNKINYLKEVMKNLVDNRQYDEEIVVTDGASTDGSAEYLKDLFQQGLIQQFVSERDLGEAHGFNKAMLMAKGELIKIITSDDVFYYPAIRECKEYMLANTAIDLLITNMGNIDLEKDIQIGYFPNPYFVSKQITNHKKQIVFTCGLSLFIRKSQMPKLGLLNPNVVMVDYEYSCRNSAHSRVAYYSNPTTVRVQNAQSNFVNLSEEAREYEWRRVNFMYDKIILKPVYEYSAFELARALSGVIYRNAKGLITGSGKKKNGHKQNANERNNKKIKNVSETFEELLLWLVNENKKHKGVFKEL